MHDINLSIYLYLTKKDEKGSSPCRAQSRETMLGQVGDDQHIAPPRFRNDLINSILINDRGLPLEGKICKKLIYTTKIKILQAFH